MVTYVLKRLLQLIPVLLGVSVIVFFLLRVCAPDPAPVVLGQHATQEKIQEWRIAKGLEDPLWKQYWNFISGAVRGDLGESYYAKAPVAQEIGKRFPATVELAIVAIIFATIFGILIGTFSAVKKNSVFDNGGMILSLVGVSMPIFWLGIMMIILFSGTLHWLPSNGRIDPALRPPTVTGFMLLDSLIAGNYDALGNAVSHLVLPMVALGLYSMAIISRMTRSSMLETLNQDYVRTARAKGISERRVITGHALRNAMLPVTTVIGLQLGSLLGGAVLTESVFAWPGIGSYTVEAILKSDFPVVQGVVFMVATIFVLMNLIVDVIYAFLDPRIKYSVKEV